MTAALSWLNDLFQWIGRWFPRLVVVHPTHEGVRFGATGSSTRVGPGLVLFWPLVQDLIQVPVTTISFETCAQTLFVESGSMIPQVALISVAIQYRIASPVAAATRVLHYHALVDNRVRAAVASHWKGDTKDRAWCSFAKEDAERTLINYGIELQSLDVTQVGIGCALKNVSDWSYSDSTDGKRPTS